MKLNNGMCVVLNEENGWQATIGNLPKYLNGKPAVYKWTEGSVIGYEQESVVVEGGVTVFTNKPVESKDPEKGAPPKKVTLPEYFLPEYETPLGVDIIINHVGDCFD